MLVLHQHSKNHSEVYFVMLSDVSCYGCHSGSDITNRQVYMSIKWLTIIANKRATKK